MKYFIYFCIFINFVFIDLLSSLFFNKTLILSTFYPSVVKEEVYYGFNKARDMNFFFNLSNEEERDMFYQYNKEVVDNYLYQINEKGCPESKNEIERYYSFIDELKTSRYSYPKSRTIRLNKLYRYQKDR